MDSLNRIPPAGPVSAYKTFQISRPLGTHFRKATCEEVNCDYWRDGWITRVDDEERRTYIRRHSGRKFEETAPGVFRFAPGQMCFSADAHRVPLEREGIYVARAGDHRGNPTGEKRVHTRPADWVEEFAEHQDWLKTLQERG